VQDQTRFQRMIASGRETTEKAKKKVGENRNVELEVEEETMKGMFEEPVNYFQPDPQPSYVSYKRQKVSHDHIDAIYDVKLRLIESHPLWGHYLWNAGIVMAQFLDETGDVHITGKNVLELGAGAGLPSIIAALNSPKKMICTDYPDLSLINNLTGNVKANIPHLLENNTIEVLGYVWGKDTDTLQKHVDNNKFDAIILSDVICNHREHDEILKCCKESLQLEGKVFVSFSHHRPWLIEKDMHFFRIATNEYGFEVTKLFERVMSPMFINDPGNEQIRSTVHFYQLTHK